MECESYFEYATYFGSGLGEKSLLKVLFRTGAISGLLIITPACSEPAVKVDQNKIRPAKLHAVETGSSDRVLNFPAVIEATKSSELTFQVTGQITSLRVLEAQEVKRGQIIATVEERDYQNNLTQAQVQFQNAENEFQRAKRLYQQNAISRSVLEKRETSRDVAQASLDSAQKSRGDTILRAPFDGGISRVLVEQFQNVQAKEPIAIIQSDDVQALVSVPADLVARSKQFESRGAYVVLDAAPLEKIPAEFREASGLADATTQTFQVAFSFEVPEDLLVLPGMTATVFLDVDFSQLDTLLPTGISIPVSAIISENGEQYVWKVDPDTMTISRQVVSAGRGMDGDLVTVTQGLSNGDVIVASGGSFLSAGTKIRPWVHN